MPIRHSPMQNFKLIEWMKGLGNETIQKHTDKELATMAEAALGFPCTYSHILSRRTDLGISKERPMGSQRQLEYLELRLTMLERRVSEIETPTQVSSIYTDSDS